MRILKSESKLDRALTVILAISIIIAVVSLIYVVVTPKTGEKFTEFYILGSNGKAEGYPRNLAVGEKANVIIGIVNREYKTVNYTIEIWLINQTTNENETIYHHMWFLDKIKTMLQHREVNIEETWQSQWEKNYTFNINKVGNFKLAFLLFTTPTESYSYDEDYRDIAAEKINSANRELHLWVNVT